MQHAVVSLPGGLALPGGDAVAEAEIRPLSGRDEEWLAGLPAHVPASVVVTDLLTRVTVRLGPWLPPERRHLLDLPLADRDFLLLAVRQATHGSHFDVVVDCPSCASLMDVSFEAEDLPVERRPPPTGPQEARVRRHDGTEARVTFRLPSGADLEAAAGRAGGEPTQVLLARCVETVDGGPGGAEGLGRLDPAALEDLEEAVGDAGPKVELAMDLTCPECEHAFAADFDLALYLLQELRIQPQQLLRELHTLASQYHWSETDIMAMPRTKRRALVELVADDRRALAGG